MTKAKNVTEADRKRINSLINKTRSVAQSLRGKENSVDYLMDLYTSLLSEVIEAVTDDPLTESELEDVVNWVENDSEITVKDIKSWVTDGDVEIVHD